MRARRNERCGLRRNRGMLADACLTSGSVLEVPMRRCARFRLD